MRVNTTKTTKLTIEVDESDTNDSDGGLTGSFACPKCEKGIVSIGRVHEIRFPAGILASAKYGDQIFYHYTCDRCAFKILIQDESDLAQMKHQGCSEIQGRLQPHGASRIVKITLQDSNYDPHDSAGTVSAYSQTDKSDGEINAVFDELISKYENYAEENGGEEIFWAEIPQMVAEKVGSVVKIDEFKKEC